MSWRRGAQLIVREIRQKHYLLNGIRLEAPYAKNARTHSVQAAHIAAPIAYHAAFRRYIVKPSSVNLELRSIHIQGGEQTVV
jgi:hypothetical protein